MKVGVVVSMTGERANNKWVGRSPRLMDEVFNGYKVAAVGGHVRDAYVMVGNESVENIGRE